MNHFGIFWYIATLVVVCGGETWKWPEGAESPSVRIDTKLKIIDVHESQRKPKSDASHSQHLLDEAPFVLATETEGFYNRPPNSGRYPVRIETHESSNTPRGNNFPYDGYLDSQQYCKCVSNPDCQQLVQSYGACGSGKYLCCYKRQTRHHSEVFNEIEDERPMLFPGHERLARPFPPPPTEGTNLRTGVLIGPGGPTGNVGPRLNKHDKVVGQGNQGLLVGPNGSNGLRPLDASETAQRGVLVGPGGATGIIGPGGYVRRPILVGPSGPTGIIGPRGYGRQGYERQASPGVLVGPGGPTGIIGPGRPILSGPGGPTGVIGPQQKYFGK